VQDNLQHQSSLSLTLKLIVKIFLILTLIVRVSSADSYTINYIGNWSDTTYSISGYVKNSTSVLNNSNVSYSGGYNLTNSSGYYIISNITNGTYNFTASKSGYISNTTSRTINGTNLTNQNFTLLNVSGNLVNFSFTNKSLSETQIYQSSQSTRIRVDVNDSDGHINNVSVGITLSGVETNYTMTGGNDTWIYDFKSGVPGVYSVSNFYATDNESGINSSTSTLQFIVVPVITDGSVVVPKPTYTAIPTFTQVPVVTVTIQQPKVPFDDAEASLREMFVIFDDVPQKMIEKGIAKFNTLPREIQWSAYVIIFIGVVMYSTKSKKKRRY